MDDQQREAVKAQWHDAIAAAGEALLRHAIVDAPADSAGWIDSGVEARPGETITMLSAGRAHLAADPSISFAANLFLWRRIGCSGRIAKFAAPTTTFAASEAGNIMLAAHYPGAWIGETGEFDPDWPREAASGAFAVAILVWKGAADDALARFAAFDESSLGLAEHARLLAPVEAPRGWRALWRTGATEVYRAAFEATDAPRIVCCCADDAGIIKYPADIPLDETTRLSWRWRVTALPSNVNEDDAATHDYLSIAVEFDNGLDLTYMWSASLPVGTSFRCPLPWWIKRETHQVVRAGRTELGRWLAEEQPVLADYARAIGGAPPARIIGVWLIAVAAFQRRRGRCEYRSIRVNSAGSNLDVWP